MLLIFVAFVSGILTILTPCVLPILPVIVGGAASEGVNKKKAVVITLSLAVSAALFTILLRATTLFIAINPAVWKTLSGGILILLGLIMLLPNLWTKIAIATGIENKSNENLVKASTQKGILGDILMGAALGPVFTSCSPTYALIIAVIFPQNFISGIFLTFIYALGLAFSLLILALGGQKVVSKVRGAANPNSSFKKGLGVLILIIGILVAFGLDKKLETYLLENSGIDFTFIDNQLMEAVDAI